MADCENPINFDFLQETLNQAAFSIHTFVVVPLLNAISLRRYNHGFLILSRKFQS